MKNVKKQYFTFVFGPLAPEGERTVPAIMSNKRMYLGKDEKFRGTFFPFTVMNLWQLTDFALNIFRPVLISAANMVRVLAQTRRRIRLSPRCDKSHRMYGVSSRVSTRGTTCLCSTVGMHLRNTRVQRYCFLVPIPIRELISRAITAAQPCPMPFSLLRK